MTYFPVFVIDATYLYDRESDLEFTAEDIAEKDNITVYTWETDVSDYDDDTYWRSEDGMAVPHWIEVIF